MGTAKEAYEQVVRLLAEPGKETFTIYELEPLLTAASGLRHESRASSDLSLSMATRSNELRTFAQVAKQARSRACLFGEHMNCSTPDCGCFCHERYPRTRTWGPLGSEARTDSGLQ